MKKILLLIITVFGSVTLLQAQIIDTARFRLNFNPQLMNFQKLNQQVEINDTTNETVHFEYYITPQRPDITFMPSPMKAVKMPSDVMKRFYRNFIKLGFGYPITPLIDLSVHNPDNSKYSYGINVHHFSSWAPQIGKKMSQYAYGPTSDTRAHLFFNRFFKHQTLYSSIGYNHELAHLYGFNRDTLQPYTEDIDRYYDKECRDTLNNSFHHLKAEVGLRSNYVLEDKRLKQDVRLNYNLISTHKKDMENHLSLKTYFAYDARFMKVSGSQNYRLGFDFDYYNNRWNDTLSSGSKRVDNSFKIELKPTVNFTIKEYHIKFGLGLPILYNREKTRVPVYPVVELQLGLIPGLLSFYAGVDGESKYNSLQSLLYENPFVKPQLDSLVFSRTQISIYGGVKGNLVKKLNYRISARYSFVQDMHFFMLDTLSLLKNQFDVMYGDAQMLNVSLNMNWEVIDHLFLNLDANYWNYFFIDEHIGEAWYKPNWQVAFGGRYVYKDKMIFDLNFDLEFGRKGLMPTTEQGVYLTKTMKPILDFSIGFEYMITKRFSTFAKINNIACQNYSKYYDFKSYGINALVGITYSFGDETLSTRRK